MKLPYTSKSGKTLVIPKEFVIHIFTEIQKEQIHDLGICGNVFFKVYKTLRNTMDTAYICKTDYALEAYMEKIAKTWSFYSGNANYPIPSENSYTSAKDYFHSHNNPKWEGNQRKLRQDLLKHLIANARPLYKKLENKT
jgi:hypothetical protein